MKPELYYHHSAVASVPKEDKPRKKEKLEHVVLRDLQEGDLDTVHEILRANIVQAPEESDEAELQLDEVGKYQVRMRESLKKRNSRHYTVATIEGEVAGIFGYMRLGNATRNAVRESNEIIPDVPIGGSLQDAPVSELIDELRTAELVNFYVDPKRQNQGIGSKMWQHVHDSIEQEGFEAIAFLSTDRHSYMWDWYKEKQGYKEVARGEYVDFGYPCSYFYKVLPVPSIQESSTLS